MELPCNSALCNKIGLIFCATDTRTHQEFGFLRVFSLAEKMREDEKHLDINAFLV